MCDASCIAGKQAPGAERWVTGSRDLSVLNVLSVGVSGMVLVGWGIVLTLVTLFSSI